MSEYIAWDDCVARYEGWDIFPTEWEGFPIHHTDPFWNAALFDEPQDQEVVAYGHDLSVYGDLVSNTVRLRASATAGSLLLVIENRGVHQSIWLEQSALQSLLDYIHTAK